LKSNEGFTLLELLVVVAIVSILAAIALPSFLNQVNKARLAEALAYAGSVNRGQQAYFAENAEFANTFTQLELGIPATTDNYSYTIDAATPGVSASFTATPQNPSINGAAGRAFVKGGATQTVICEGSPGQVPAMAAIETVEQCPN